MHHFVIEGKWLKTEDDFHKQVAHLFKFPSYYGKNLDAFWDCITDCALGWKKEGKVIIEWRDHQMSKKSMDEIDDRDFDIIVKMFETLRSDWNSDLELILS